MKGRGGRREVGRKRRERKRVSKAFFLANFCFPSFTPQYCREYPGSVVSLLFSPSGHRLYAGYSNGTLAMFNSEQQACPLLRLLGNTLVKGIELGPQALALSEDGRRLGYVGPLPCNVTILDAQSLNEASYFYK